MSASEWRLVEGSACLARQFTNFKFTLWRRNTRTVRHGGSRSAGCVSVGICSPSLYFTFPSMAFRYAGSNYIYSLKYLLIWIRTGWCPVLGVLLPKLEAAPTRYSGVGAFIWSTASWRPSADCGLRTPSWAPSVSSAQCAAGLRWACAGFSCDEV